MSNSLLSNLFQQKKVMIGYITFGDYSKDFTMKACKEMINSGVDVIEIGLPFSDPIADGPIIQASHQRALSTTEDLSINSVIEFMNSLKQYAPNTPIILMASTNLIMQFGYASFFTKAKSCDGLIMPDSSIEMLDNVIKVAKAHSFSLIHLISPLCTRHRMEKIVKASNEFIYLISSTGITGERAAFSKNLKSLISDIKSIKPVPVAIGFGVSKPDHVSDLYTFADGVIIGSHFVNIVTGHMPNTTDALDGLSKRIKELIGK